jgi:thiol-disulfide isomerase/thioredoxin
MHHRSKRAGITLALLALGMTTACSTGDDQTVEGAADHDEVVSMVGWKVVDDGPDMGLPPGDPLTEVEWSETSSLRLVNFWASTCAPCRREIPVLNELARESGVQVIGVSRDQFAKYARQFEEEVGAEFPSWIDPDGEYAERLSSWVRPHFLPLSALVRDDRVVAVHQGEVKDSASVLAILDEIDR